jgi:cytochrome P450
MNHESRKLFKHGHRSRIQPAIVRQSDGHFALRQETRLFSPPTGRHRHNGASMAMIEIIRMVLKPIIARLPRLQEASQALPTGEQARSLSSHCSRFASN